MKTRDLLLALNQLNKVNTKTELLQEQLKLTLSEDNTLADDYDFQEIIAMSNSFHGSLSALCDRYRKNLMNTYENNANGTSQSKI